MRYRKTFAICRIFLFVFILLMPVKLSAQNDVAKGGYGDMLYPFVHDYDQTLTYKISVDYGRTSETAKLTADEVLQVIERIDNLTRGMIQAILPSQK